MCALLDIRNLQIRFGAAEAVRGISLQIDEGEVLGLVGEIASRVAVMRAGQIVETGSSRKLLTNPEHAYTRSLLAAVPTLRTDRSRPLAMVK